MATTIKQVVSSLWLSRVTSVLQPQPLLSRATAAPHLAVMRTASTNRPAAAAVRVLARPTAENGALLALGPLRLGPGQRGGLATGMTLGLSPSLHTAARALVCAAPPLLDAVRTPAAAVAADIKRVEGEIEQAGADIKRVEAKIEDVEAQLKVALTPQDVAYLRDKEKQLRDEKKQLRDKEKQLRDEVGRLEDRQNKLLDKENAGSCFDRNVNRSHFFAAVEIRTRVVALHTLCIQIQAISSHLPLSPANAPTVPLPQLPGKRHRFSALLYFSFSLKKC